MAVKVWAGSLSQDWSVAGNWTPSGVPIAGDDVYFKDSGVACNLGLGQSAIVLDSLHVSQSYTGTLGGDAGEYLQIATTILDIGGKLSGQTGLGSSRILIDLGTTTACEVTVYTTGATVDGLSALDIIANNANTNFLIKSGSVGIGSDLSANVVGTFNLHGGTTLISSTVTMTKINQSGGLCESNSDLPDIDLTGGQLIALDGVTAITTALMDDTAQLDLQTSGALTITTLTVVSGVLNALIMNAVTITTLKVAPKASINLDNRFVTLTNDVQLLTTAISKRFKIQS